MWRRVVVGLGLSGAVAEAAAGTGAASFAGIFDSFVVFDFPKDDLSSVSLVLPQRIADESEAGGAFFGNFVVISSAAPHAAAAVGFASVNARETLGVSLAAPWGGNPLCPAPDAWSVGRDAGIRPADSRVAVSRICLSTMSFPVASPNPFPFGEDSASSGAPGDFCFGTDSSPSPVTVSASQSSSSSSGEGRAGGCACAAF